MIKKWFQNTAEGKGQDPKQSVYCSYNYQSMYACGKGMGCDLLEEKIPDPKQWDSGVFLRTFPLKFLVFLIQRAFN